MNKILDLIFVKLPAWLDRFGERCAKKQPVQKKPQTAISKTHVTATDIYTQDWSKEETLEERIARLKRMASNATKSNRR
jgi:hypothetical protein